MDAAAGFRDFGQVNVKAVVDDQGQPGFPALGLKPVLHLPRAIAADQPAGFSITATPPPSKVPAVTMSWIGMPGSSEAQVCQRHIQGGPVRSL